MKKILTLALSALTLTLSAQVTGRIITDHVKVDDLVWSDLEKEWMFFENTERYPEFNMIETDLKSDLSGKLRVTNIQDRQIYDFLVIESNFEESEYGEMMVMECMEVSSGDKCTIIVHKIGNEHMISLMLPGSRMAIFFDNLSE